MLAQLQLLSSNYGRQCTTLGSSSTFHLLAASAMFINSLPDTDGSRCTLTFEEPDHWLRATWRSFIDSDEAKHGADNYLAHAGDFHCPYLLNDNLAL